MPDPGAQAGEGRPSWISHSLAAGACLGVQVFSAMGAKPSTVLAAQGLGWKRQQHLLPQDVLQQNTIPLIITDFGFRSGDGMLRSIAIGPGWPKKQVKLPRKLVLDRIKAPGAEGFKAAGIGGADSDVVNKLIRTAVLDYQVGSAVNRKRIKLADVEAVLNTAGFKGEFELNRFPLEINNSEKHGRCHRD